MEYFLLQIVAFLRPIFFMEIGLSSFFDIGGIGIVAVFLVALLIRGAVGQTLAFNSVDALIAAFSLWCVLCALIYPDTLDVRSLGKVVAPFLCYTVAKNVLRTPAQYMRMLALMILGYVLPVVISAGMIMVGKGAEKYGADYWTGLVRWQGIYDGAHNLGHNMTFLLMLVTLFVSFRKFGGDSEKRALSKPMTMALTVLVILALYCLWLAQVRTALLGLLVFTAVYLFYRNKRLLVVGAAVTTIVTISLFPILKPYLFPDVIMIEQTGGNIAELGSGRPEFWKSNLEHFAELPFDRQLAGVGIGNNRMVGFMDSHNDILDVLIQTGLIGFGIFVALQVALTIRLFRLSGFEKYMFLAAFLAVLVMNFASNSYVARFGLAQMYYMVIAFVDIRLKNRSE